jgi:hypothetical protein
LERVHGDLDGRPDQLGGRGIQVASRNLLRSPRREPSEIRISTAAERMNDWPFRASGSVEPGRRTGRSRPSCEGSRRFVKRSECMRIHVSDSSYTIDLLLFLRNSGMVVFREADDVLSVIDRTTEAVQEALNVWNGFDQSGTARIVEADP